MKDNDLDDILKRAWDREPLSNMDIQGLLSVGEGDDLKELFRVAKAIRRRSFGDQVFLYGFVYFSTYCHNDCSFCFYRSSNQESVRYRKTKDEIIALATSLEDAGVHLIDLTMGEDPLYRSEGRRHALLDIIGAVNEAVDVPLMASPGVMPKSMFEPLREAGVDWFACYQETHNRDLFVKLRPDQDYSFRYNQKLWAQDAGMLAEEGIMIGVGESLRDRADSIQIMGNQGVRQVRAMTFVPQANTPMWSIPSSSYTEELVTLAVMRLVHQDKLIPASLDIEGIRGLQPRLDAGANVITSIIPPSEGLAGVAQHDLDINTGGRSAQSIEGMLEDLDIKVGSTSQYEELIEGWKRTLRCEVPT
ncbi:MAG: methylornithine synthase PylB [Methanomassiliicoccus sp.]|nr:methylornithine synthase PylB [Methanomassiliicoccus sp.]